MRLLLIPALAAGWLSPFGALAAPVSEIVVVGRAPLGGSEAGLDAAPRAATVLESDDISPALGSALLGALERQAPGVTLSNAQGQSYQPSLFYRGFEASPLQGVSQGLAVYVDGVRLNQPFGETVNWDLIPEAAIQGVALQGADPVFGLNALGGSLALRLKTGFDDPGGEAEVATGSYRRVRGQVAYGAAGDRLGVFVAASGLDDRGWRRFSPTTLRQGYADLGWRDGPLKIDLGLIGADNDLTGNGPAPVELLAADRRAVFTHPDRTENRYAQARLSGSYEVSPTWALQAQIYAARLRQRTVNGDATEAEPCESDEDILCLEEDGPILTDDAGEAIEAFAGEGPYAVLNGAATRTNRWGAAVQAVAGAPLFGRENAFAVGASLDASRTIFAATTRLGVLTEDRGFGGPGILIDQDDGPIAPVGLSVRTTYVGLYLTDTLHVTPALALTASGRFDHAELKLRDRIGASLNGDHSFDRFNPAFGATYALTSTLSAYAGFAQASRTPTPAELSCASPEAPCSLTNFFLADPPLKIVTSRTWEAGLRGRRQSGGRALSWSAGLFRSDNDNDISRVASEVRGRGFFENIGRTRRQGAEAQVEGAAGAWRGYAAYAFTDATFRTPLTLTSPDNPSADEFGLIHVQPGDRIPSVARHLLKAGVAYELSRWRVALDAVAASGRPLAGDEANREPRTAGYVVANLSGTLRLTSRVEAFMAIENLADRRYETFGIFTETDAVALTEAPGASNPRSLTPAPPRTFEVGLRARF